VQTDELSKAVSIKLYVKLALNKLKLRRRGAITLLLPTPVRVYKRYKEWILAKEI
jgi:hypothetical protein